MSRRGRGSRLKTVVVLALGAAVVAVIAAACGGAGGPTGLLVGKVTLGPITPVEQAGGPPNIRPYSATVTIETTEGTAVTTVTSGRDGAFSVRLAAGSYRLVPRSPAGRSFPHTAPLDVVVVAGQTAAVTIAFDSGIR